MARASSRRLEQVRAWIDETMRAGYPEDLVEMFEGVQALFDNADKLIALFGVVDESSVSEAWEKYRAFALSLEKRRGPTLH